MAINLRELSLETMDVEGAISFSQRLGLLPDKSEKPCCTVSCGNSLSVTVVKHANQKNCPYRLKCSMCNTTWSLRNNTWFAGSHMELWQVLHITYSFLEQLTIEQTIAALSVSNKTVIDWFNYCREVCHVILNNSDEQIGGEAHVVEFECHLRTNKHHRGRLSFGDVERVWVIGGIDRTTSEAFIVHTEKRDPQTLVPILRHFIRPGSVVITDEWKAYQHIAEPHSLNFMSPRDSVVNGQSGKQMRRSLKSVFPEGGRRSDNLYLYLSEFLYRQSRPIRIPDLFPVFLDDIKRVYPGYGKTGITIRL